MKRFYKEVAVVGTGEGFALRLDARPVRTSGKAALVLSGAALAGAVVEEWRAQGETIEPATMPLTRLANSILDGVRQNRAEMIEQIIAYAGSDLLCYRAGEPEGLVARQTALWDPVLAWAADTLGARMRLAEGVVHVAQDEAALACLRRAIEEAADFTLGALAVVTTLTGSALLALALARGRLDAGAVWQAANVDEDWQIAEWGEDAEAMAVRRKRRAEMDAAARVLALA